MLVVFISLFLLFIISAYIYGSKQTASSEQKMEHDSTKKNNEKDKAANTVNNTNEDDVPQLHLAVFSNDTKTAQILIDNQANIEAKDYD